MWREVFISDIFRELERDDLLPAIVFRTARAQCDRDAEQSIRNRGLHLTPTAQRELKLKVHEVAERYEMDMELLTTHPHYSALLTTAIGAHHAGQLLMWRLLLEELMASGLLRILVATGTVAAGVDFPARTVVITAHSRRGAEGYQSLSTSEFQQMSGRAGRRGKDSVGFCVVAPSTFCDARLVAPLAKNEAEPLVSAYFPSPSTVLNLMRHRNVDDLRFTVERSLAAYVDKREAKELRNESAAVVDSLPDEVAAWARQSLQGVDGLQAPALGGNEKRLVKKARRFLRRANELEQRQANLLESSLGGLRALGYLDDESLSEKGFWAANLCTSLVIELAEVIEAGLLADPSMERLTAIIASIAGDAFRPYLKAKGSPISGEDQKALQSILERVADQNMPGVTDERKVLPDAAYTALVWLEAEDWHSFRSLLLLSGGAEGDAARLIAQTAEQLNQLTHLRESHPDLAAKAEYARNRLLRPPLTELEVR